MIRTTFQKLSLPCLSLKKCEMNSLKLRKCIKGCVPPLDGGSHKGQAGRIGIIGGSLEYTGAPYFAGISALKVGADLVHIFCASPAATVIKSYSPELIVHPLLDQPNATNEISPWLDRLHAVVIGPGLGRDKQTFEVVSELINVMRQKCIPLIIDADGLFLITENPHLIKDYPLPGVILTPNKIEFERLQAKLIGSYGHVDLSQLGGHVSILGKGQTDEFFSGCAEVQWQNGTGGSGRRCGGQGDLLSGTIATFLHWTLNNKDLVADAEMENVDKSTLAASLSCYAASSMIRLCNQKAFQLKGRSMLATDMIDHIHDSFEELFGQ